MDNLNLPTSNVSTPTSTNPNLKWYLMLIVFTAILIPSLTLNLLNASKKNLPQKSNSTNQPTNINNSLFESQSASFKGKITKIEGDKIWLQSNTGTTGEIKLSPNLITSNPKLGAVSSTSADTQQIELEKEVIINFLVVEGEYQAIAIAYTSPINSDIQASPLPPPVEPTGSKLPQLQQTNTPLSSITPLTLASSSAKIVPPSP